MATGTVKSAIFKKSGTGKFGDFHIFDIQIEGDDKTYQYMAKTNPQDKFVVGKQAEFTTETKQNGQYTNHSIKPVQANSFGGGNPQRLETDKKIAALNNAVNLVCAGKVDVAKLKETAEKLLKEYLN